MRLFVSVGRTKKRLRRCSTKALTCPSLEPSILAALRPWGWSGGCDPARLAVPGQSHQAGKRCAVGHRHLREHLPVDLNAGRLEASHQPAVGEAVLPRGSVDPNDPEPVEIPLLVAAIPILIVERVQD